MVDAVPEEGTEAAGRRVAGGRFQEEVQAVVSVGSTVQSPPLQPGPQPKPCQSEAFLSVLLL